MRIKFLVAKSLILALPLTLIPVFASSATKVTPGSKCKVQKQKIDYQDKTYTCIRSGKKLVWNKGAAVVNPTPLQTPISKPTPTTTPTYERKDWEIVYLKIWDELNNAQNQGTFPFVYRLSPTVNQAKASESIAAYDKAMKLWLAILNGAEVSPVIWTIMSEKDYAWWKQVVDEQEKINPNYAWDPNTNVLGHCGLSPRAFCGYGNTYQSNTPNYKYLQYNVIGSGYSGFPNSNTVNHESVHFYQLSVVQGFPRDLPCWYVEGQASLYGGALEFNLTSERNSSIAQRERFKDIVRQYQPEANTYSSKDWVAVLQNMYQPHISCSGQQDYFKYAAGMFIWEYLYSNYGPKLMHQVLLDFKAGKLFAQTAQDKFNLTVDQLNMKLAEHLVHIFARGN
jgi:hypothetical protein